MHFLRRITTRQLILACAALIVVACGGTALALAAGSGGPVPPSKPLAQAVHQAIAAPSPDGVTARVQFTNHLIDGVDIRGSNPLLSGATGRLWATKDGHFRLELQSTGGGGDAQIVSDGKTWWAYDGSSNTVYRGTIPQDHKQGTHAGWQPPTTARIQQVINRVMQHANISGPVPGDIAGQPAYTVRVEPKRDGGLVGAVEFAWDATHGVPLRAAIYARGDSTPVLELKATDISFGPVDMSAFSISPPAGAHAQTVAPGNGAGAAHKGQRHDVTGLARVQRRTHFKIAAPATLAGRARTSVDLIPGGGAKQSGAAVVYGRGLGGIAVIERPVTAAGNGNGNGPLAHANLPTVTINGVKAEELSTPLGSVIRFQRGGVSYVVLGSVSHAAAEAAARGL